MADLGPELRARLIEKGAEALRDAGFFAIGGTDSTAFFNGVAAAVIDALLISPVPIEFIDDETGGPWPDPPRVPPVFRLGAAEEDS